MTNTNKVVLAGNLVRNVTDNEYDFSYTSGGTARANICMAVNRSRKQGDEWVNDVNYFDVTVWGKTAENLKSYFTKGQKVIVTGFLKQDRWEKDGQKHSKITIIAENVELCGSRDGNSNNSGNNTNENRGTYQQPQQQNYDDGFAPAEDIPF